MITAISVILLFSWTLFWVSVGYLVIDNINYNSTANYDGRYCLTCRKVVKIALGFSAVAFFLIITSLIGGHV